MAKNPPPKFGEVINGEYVWDNSKPLPDYFHNGQDMITSHIPEGHVGRHTFYMGDDQANFDKFLKKYGPDWHYATKEVYYDINSKGLRAKELDEYDWQNSIVVIGCSCVFGVGVAEDETFTYFLQQKTERQVINIGIPGSSNLHLFNTSLTLRKKYGNPFALFMMWTGLDRFPYYGKVRPHHIGLWDCYNTGTTQEEQRYKRLFDDMNEDRSNVLIHLWHIAEASKGYWEDKTKYLSFSVFEDSAHYTRANDYLPFSNTARDNLHPGPNDFKTHADVVEQLFIELYGENSL